MGASSDIEAAAEDAGLVYADLDEPGLTRRRCGRGFTYLSPSGRPVSGGDRARISSLVIPPAWTDVWISPHADDHIQATGRDADGRKQYLYHPLWRATRDADKFAHLAAFGAGLPALRRQVQADLSRPGLPEERVTALVVRLLDETLIRVGNRAYAANGAFGLTTLRPEHVEVRGADAVFEFTGKSGTDHEIHLHADRSLATLIARCDEAGGEQLFTYRGEDAEPVPVTSDTINSYLRRWVDEATSARDFRTWGATATAIGTLAPDPPPSKERERNDAIREAIDLAAERLGNTRSVCRSAYVHPIVEEAFERGELHDAWLHARRTPTMDRAERTLVRLLDG